MNALDKRLRELRSQPQTELVNDLMYLFSYGKDNHDQIVIYTGCYDNGDGTVSKAEDFGNES